MITILNRLSLMEANFRVILMNYKHNSTMCQIIDNEIFIQKPHTVTSKHFPLVNFNFSLACKIILHFKYD